jgi:hypothetical protein
MHSDLLTATSNKKKITNKTLKALTQCFHFSTHRQCNEGVFEVLIISLLQGATKELSSVTRSKNKTLLPLAHERWQYIYVFMGFNVKRTRKSPIKFVEAVCFPSANTCNSKLVNLVKANNGLFA